MKVTTELDSSPRTSQVTTSDKITIGMGLAQIITMVALAKFAQRVGSEFNESIADPDTEQEERSYRNLKIFCAIVFLESLGCLGLLWYLCGNDAVTFSTVLFACIAVLGLILSVSIPLLASMMSVIRSHVLITREQNTVIREQFQVLENNQEIMRMIAAEVDKKADSRKKNKQTTGSSR
jgi:hypothetical protein